MRRIWVETLPASELASPATLSLLKRWSLQPLIALSPQHENAAMDRAFAELAARDIPLGIWPLLPDTDGYWAGERNAELYSARLFEALERTRASSPVRTVAIDLEPPLDRVCAFFDKSRTLSAVESALREALRPDVVEVRRRARVSFGELQRSLAVENVETVAAVVPLVIFDLATEHRPWQALLGTPIEPPFWDRICPMLYGSLAAKSLSAPVIEHVLFAAGRVLVEHVGTKRAAAALGLAGPGKLGNEAFYATPELLARDVAAIRAAGIEDLALFSLEGVLAREHPEAWLRAFCEAPPLIPAGKIRRAAFGAGAKMLTRASLAASFARAFTSRW